MMVLKSILQTELQIYIAKCLMSLNVVKCTVNQSYSSISSSDILEGTYLESLHHRSSWSLYCYSSPLRFSSSSTAAFSPYISNTHSCFNLPLIFTFLTLSVLEPPSILLNALICVASICPLCLVCKVHASQPYVKVGVTIALTTHTFVISFLPSTVLLSPQSFLMPFLFFAPLHYPCSHHC